MKILRKIKGLMKAEKKIENKIQTGYKECSKKVEI